MDVEYIPPWYLLTPCLRCQACLLEAEVRSHWLSSVVTGSPASGQCDHEGT